MDDLTQGKNTVLIHFCPGFGSLLTVLLVQHTNTLDKGPSGG